MNCPECNRDDCNGTWCVCGWKAYSKGEVIKRPREFVMQTCSIPGCTTAIRSLAGQQMNIPVCKWCAAGETRYGFNRAPQQPHRVIVHEEHKEDEPWSASAVNGSTSKSAGARNGSYGPVST